MEITITDMKNKSLNNKKIIPISENKMETVILFLPIKFEELIKYIYHTDDDNQNIEDIWEELNVNNNVNEIKTDLNNVYKMGDATDILNTFNTKSAVYTENKKNITITNTLTDLIYLETINEIVIDGYGNNEKHKLIKAVKTDIACWWDCHTFDSYPISLPIKYNSDTSLFSCKGVFCSFSCAKAFAGTKKEYTNSYYLINLLYKKLNGLKPSQITTIIKAPPKETLRMFGGLLDINEFRNTSSTLDIYDIICYPMIFMNERLHKESKSNSNKNNYMTSKNNQTSAIVLTDNVVNAAKNRLISNNKSINTLTNSLKNNSLKV